MGTGLEALLPRAEDAPLLRACLPSGESGTEAYATWVAEVEDPVAAARGWNPGRGELLAPMLHAARHNGTRLDPRLTHYLRAAWAHEELRGEALAAALPDLPHDAVLLPGAGLVAATYGCWPLRHCHDLDVLTSGPPGRAMRSDGVVVSAHAGLSPHPVLRLDEAGARSRAVPALLAGREVCVLSPADALVHLCVLAACRRAPRLRWAIDAWWLCDAHDVEWAVVVDQARAGGSAALLKAHLGWVAEELRAAVPTGVLASLGRAALLPSALPGLRAALGLARRRVGARAMARGALSRN